MIAFESDPKGPAFPVRFGGRACVAAGPGVAACGPCGTTELASHDHRPPWPGDGLRRGFRRLSGMVPARYLMEALRDRQRKAYAMSSPCQPIRE